MVGRPLLAVEDLVVGFATKLGNVSVLNGVSFRLGAGEILGIVGESGCGKSMAALAVMGLVPAPNGRIIGGHIHYRGEDLVAASEARRRAVRGASISMIFQEPMTSLNPVFTIGDQIAETIRLHDGASRSDARRRALAMLQAVQIPAAATRLDSYPHELSGGMRQRVMIAMALACKPDVLIADEPTTALDVTVQAQIFDLLRSVGEETGAGIILITHDMGSIAEIADRVLVMYAGHMVETGSVDQVLTAPAHPYTQGLIACVPHVRAGLVGDPPPLVEIPGIVPSMTEPIEGCPFAPRCAHRMSRCREALPPPIWKERGHQVACFLNDESHAEPEASSHRAGTPC